MIPAEETPAGDAREVIGCAKLAILFESDAAYGIELGDAPLGIDARIWSETIFDS